MVLLEARNLTKVYGRGPKAVVADQDISFALPRGSSLGILGRSGCGKSTLARLLMGIEPATAGTVLWQGEPVHWQDGAARKAYYRKVQLVFQDALASFHPLYTVGMSLRTALRNYGASREEAERRAVEAFAAVGLPPSLLDKRPAELSGGEGQRAGIARAMSLEPDVILCDEISSALDALSQKQVEMALQSLRARGTALLLISHDISFLGRLCDELLVLQQGRVVERGPAAQILQHPQAAETRFLLEQAFLLSLENRVDS
ncbi:MAG: hypothetical protein ACFWT7_06915 [Succiniclasticum sp.]|jgi:ABC-type dipeptide/oligopeptide/nickel transport system ATPase subunit